MNRRISVEPLARVEGHGGIEVLIKDDRVKDVRVNIFEGPRLMEQLTIGKSPEEAVSITSRICAICFVSHRFSDIRAHEKALGITPSKRTKLLRKLAHYGEIIESNALHYYFLALPDYFNCSDIIEMTQRFPGVTKGALELKKYGNRIMEVVCGRRIHGENMRIGTFGMIPPATELDAMKTEALELLPRIEKGIELWGKVKIPSYMEEDTVFASVLPDDDDYGFVSDTIIVSTGDRFSADDYGALTNERVVPHSFSKRCRYRGKPYTVGALARMLNMSDRLSGQAADTFKKFYNEGWHRNPHYNNIAQAIEILFCLEHIPPLIDEIARSTDGKPAQKNHSGTGTGVVEAPRGLLIHHYAIEDDRVTYADYVIPTTQNLDDMEKYMKTAAEYLLERKVKDIALPLEMIVRAYDPCISCSVHMVTVKQV
jgi:sulfhydrogenase subunit alpha